MKKAGHQRQDQKVWWVIVLFILLLFPVRAEASQEWENRGFEKEAEEEKEKTEDEERKKTEEALEEIRNEIPFDEVEKVLSETELSEKISFTELLEKFLKGNTEWEAGETGRWIVRYFFTELQSGRKNFVRIFLLSVLSALFTNMASGFSASALQETGFYAAYLSITVLILGSFFLMSSIVSRGCCRYSVLWRH